MVRTHGILEIRYNDLGPEDVQNLLEYFRKTQAENPAFYYAVQVENNNCMTNIFWADAKARMAYYYFGGAVRLDTTYKNNKKLMPIVRLTDNIQVCRSGSVADSQIVSDYVFGWDELKTEEANL